jgi:hypothetical protein
LEPATIHNTSHDGERIFEFFLLSASILNAKKPFKHLGVKGEAHHQVSFSILGGGWTAHHTQEGISQVWVEVREECLKHFESCIVLATSRN